MPRKPKAARPHADENPWQVPDTTLTREGPPPPTLRSERPHTLSQLKGPGAPRLHVLEKSSVVMGRSPRADFRVDSAEVSRAHLRFTRDGDEYTCCDMGSRNGVYLNGVRIHAAVLREDDQLQVGDVVLVYHRGGQ